MTTVTSHLQSQVMVISLDRPEKKNALTRTMYAELANAINLAAKDEHVRAILLKGNGDCFTAGNDLSDFVAIAENDNVAETVAFMRALMQCPLPVVAQVHGLAVGIGTTMLLHCDLVYAADDTRFSLPFINLGLVPEYASSYILPRISGHRKAAKWLMLGEPFTTEEALQFGLLTDVVSADALEKTVEKVLSKLVQKPRQALRQTKALMKTDGDDVLLHMNDELDLFLEHLATPQAKEAFAAFLEKRKPNPDIFN